MVCMSGTRGVIAAATVLAVAVAAPGAASAESLVYVKGGNVWVARPDGSHAHRVTRDGTRRLPYVHPTQADNGTIVALRATDIHRFTPRGRRVGRPRRVSAGLSGPGSLHELAEASEVSPNGKRVAIQKTLLQGTSSNGIKGMTILAVSVEYRSAKTGKRLREVHQPGDYYQNPSWVGNIPPARLRAIQLVLPRGLRRHPRWIDRWLVLRRAQRRGRPVREAADRRWRAERGPATGSPSFEART